jgi:hypothetical protein
VAGVVYEAERCGANQHFALKILNPLGYKLERKATLKQVRARLLLKIYTASHLTLPAPLKFTIFGLFSGNDGSRLSSYYLPLPFPRLFLWRGSTLSPYATLPRFYLSFFGL